MCILLFVILLMHHRHVAVRVCTISILLNFHTNPYYFQ